MNADNTDKRRTQKRLVRGLVILAFLLLIVAMVPQVAFGKSAALRFWMDTFSNPTLDSRWTFINEDTTHWSLVDRPGFMKIVTQDSGVLCDKPVNLLVQPAPEGDFAIETRLYFKPEFNFQIAGLLVYQDDGNNLVLGRAYCDADSPRCVGNGIYFDHEEDNQWIEPNFATRTKEHGGTRLLLKRHGARYTAFFSVDGRRWKRLGTHLAGLKPVYIGLYVADSCQGAPERPAYFDYFRLLTR